MRNLTPLLAITLGTLLLSPSWSGGSLRAQIADDVCPMGLRSSVARDAARCLQRRTLPLPARTDAESPAGDAQFGLLDASLLGAYRSAYPVDRNNGGVWTGRGVSGSVSFGALFRSAHFTLAVEPEVSWAQNRYVRLPDTVALGISRWAYPYAYGKLDWYMRPGPDPLMSVEPGSSFAEVTVGRVRAGVSTERLWWGPARRYPLLFSGTAAGFPHAYAGTVGDVDTPLGAFGGEVLWGRLQESKWFDADPRNDLSLLGAFQLRWRSDFVPGLELSYAVVRHEPMPDRAFEAGQLAQLFTGDPTGEAAEHRGTPMGTLSIRFAYPEAGFEAYAQAGRGEGFLVPEPGVSQTRAHQIYLLGMTRTDTLASGRRWRFAAEVMKQTLELPQPRASATDGVPTGPAWKGHTHQGQALGPYTGPASNAQYLSLDLMGEGSLIGVFAERVRRDDDTYFRNYSYDYGFRGHDVEWTLGTRGGRSFQALGPGTWSVGSEVGISRRKNRMLVGLDRLNRDFVREWNLSTDVWIRWTP